MSTLLTEILAHKLEDVAKRKEQVSVTTFLQSPHFAEPTRSLKKTLLEQSGVMAEMKRKSPSAGELYPLLDPAEQAEKYMKQGACAISVLTDYDYFGGGLSDLLEVRKAVDLPLLQKDFIVDEYQLFEAKAHGADVILLIAAALTKEKCLHLSIIAKSLNLEVILEIHAEHELSFINDEIDFIMVNNRNLHLQQTDVNHSLHILPFLPANLMKISASGISTNSQVSQLIESGYNAVLIGESILKQEHLGRLTKFQSL